MTGREPAPFGGATLHGDGAAGPVGGGGAVAAGAGDRVVFAPAASSNDLTRVRLGIATDTMALTNYLGLTGSNIWVVLDDTGVDATHPDFAPAAAGWRARD